MIDSLRKFLSKEDMPDEAVEQVSQALLAAKEDFLLKEKWQNTLNANKGQKAKTNKLVLLLFLLCLAGLIAGAYWFFNSKADIPPVQYAMNYLQDSPYPINQSRGNSESEISLIKAAEAYGDEDYKKAISLYEALEAKKLLNQDGQFYLGLSLLHNGALQKSLQTFQAIEQTPSPSFQFKTELKFYLGLNYTLLEQNEDALRYLKQLQDSQWEQQTRARLIEKLEEK